MTAPRLRPYLSSLVLRALLGATCLVLLTSTASAQQADVPRNPSMGDLRQVLARLNEEPSVREVLDAAIDFHDVSQDTFESYQSRASWKAVLPKVSGEFRRSSIGIDVDGYDFPQYGDQLSTLNVISGSTHDWKVAATWDLPKLVYNPEVLDTYAVLKAREALVSEVVRLFYLRRRTLIDLLLEPPTDPRTFVSKQIYVEELTAVLDALTGGIYEGRSGLTD